MDLKALFPQLVVLYHKLTKQQKMIISAAVIGIVAFLIFMVVYTNKDGKIGRYEVLFDSLSSEDAAKVIEQLEKDQIPYELHEGNVVKVPKDVVYKERIAIASMGIPKDNKVGFELFDNQEFGATKFDQDIKYLRALEGELARTISSLAPIDSATVSLALPKKSLFVEKQSDPTASVMITVVEGRKLSTKQIRGIKNLVAASVSKLKPENVMLVDSDGETLGSEDEMAQMGELSVVQQAYKTKEEKKLQQKIVSVIAPFVGGEDKVVAQVSIEFDFSIQNLTSEKYDPENVVRSEQVSEEKREGINPAEVGGVPGTVSNIGPVQGLESDKIREKYEKNTGTTNYEVGKTVSTVKSEFARIKKISAAVIVDGKYKYKVDADGNPTSELEYESLSETDIDALISLATQSIGIDDGRGDSISVKNLQFKRQDDVAKEGVEYIFGITDTYLSPFSEVFKYLFVFILLFIVYKKVISPFAERMLEVSQEEEEMERPNLSIDGDDDEDLVEKVQDMRKKVESQLGLGGDLNEDALKHEVLLEKVKALAEEAPDEIGSILQSLLQEEFEEDMGQRR
ncbi:MAG: flagellar M-ring protein FliF [Campylobacterales bacterium]|nr:flagellar M-ring protein FliF [Campylobacterales bacterium]